MALEPGTVPDGVKAIITGATGMVGEGVLHECLKHPDVDKVLVINRKPSGISHPKLTELLHNDFFDFSTIEDQLSDYNACFFCLGVSSIGMPEEEYSHLTYDLTIHVADTLARNNKDMVFCYVTGIGTDSSEEGKRMWARVKGKTENTLMKLPFREAYMFRPGFIRPTKGLIRTKKYYKAISWTYPLSRYLFPKYVITLEEVGVAMIHSVKKGYSKSILESQDIAKLARS